MTNVSVLDPSPPPPPAVRGVVRLTAAQLRIQRRVTLILTLAPLAAVAFAVWRLWGTHLSGLDIGLFAGFYAATVIGITVGYHRLFTHRSFIAIRPVRVALALFGSMAVEGAVIDWCATHRRHHAYADQYGDPHSPHLATAPGMKGVLAGLFHAHVGWLFGAVKSDAAEWTPDLVADEDMAKINGWFGRMTLISFLLPPAIALVVTGSWRAMISGFLWGSLVRIFVLHHMTWSINSICHFYGKEAYVARDESKNVWPFAILSFGESWHNNHHAFPWSARLGLRTWQIDPGWYVIRTLQAMGLIGSVKVPNKKQLDAKSLPTR